MRLYTVLLVLMFLCVGVVLPIWPFSNSWGILPSLVAGGIFLGLWIVQTVVSLVA